MAALLALPATASAEDFVVNTLEDFSPEVGCNGGPEEECTLRDALTDAGITAGSDTVEFDVSGTLELNSPLPPIDEGGVWIDATTRPDYEGSPVIELSGEDAIANGLVVNEGGSGSRIEGLAINGFLEAGIVLASSENWICANYIGTDLSGEVTRPNGIGVVVPPRVEGSWFGNEIGYGCTPGNLISGNDEFGIYEVGEETRIGRNAIGTAPSTEDPIPNGGNPGEGKPSGGIYSDGHLTLIGGDSNANAIAFNESPGEPGSGVVIASPTVSVRANSIFENDGPGILYVLGAEHPASPEPQNIETSETGTVVSGVVQSEPFEILAIDFFVNEECDESGAGEGQGYAGSSEVQADESGQAGFEMTRPPIPAGMQITFTATRLIEAGGGSTSEFSECIEAPGAFEPDEPSNSDTSSTPILFKAPPPPAPKNGETLVVAPKSGKVFITLPGSKKKVLLEDGQEIPVGSIIDATRGKVTLTSIDKAGNVQTAVFFGGVFKVKQRVGSGLVVLELQDSLAGCKRSKRRTQHSRRAGKSSASAWRRTTKRKRRGGRLWGSGKGRFRTKGHYGAATVRGTIWLTEDRCGGTFFKVKRGVVTVRDFGAKRTFPLRKGKSYLAKP